ncbi:MAG: hypothetical protein IKI63_03245 [Clostridia bacterium]|nr:hypothetical protein [Clostridia bacterium]
MEIIKKVAVIILVLVLLTSIGCHPLFVKVYFDYPNVWVSEDGKVMLDPSGTTTIQYDGIDQNWDIGGGSDSGGGYITFRFEDPNAVDDSNVIWRAYATIIQDVLYLKIDEDYYTGLKGQTIVLKQSDIPGEITKILQSEQQSDALRESAQSDTVSE